MTPHRLENYLRSYRKESGLSQQEVAFLLGCDFMHNQWTPQLQARKDSYL